MKKINTLYIIILTTLLLYTGNTYAASTLPQGNTGMDQQNSLLPAISSYDAAGTVASPDVINAELDASIQKTEVDAKKQAAAYDQPGQKSSSTVANCPLVSCIFIDILFIL